MKSVLTLFILFSGAAFADCPTHFTCGDFRLSMPGDDGKSLVTDITVTGKSAVEAEFDYSSSGGRVLKVDTVFAADGSFTMTLPDGSMYAKGVCVNQFCTYSIHPWVKDGHTVGNAGLLVFDSGKVTLDMFSGIPGKMSETRQVLTKQ